MSSELLKKTGKITELILQAKEKAYQETKNEPEPGLTSKISWPITCTVGPGLEGAIACESEVGYVNGTKGMLIYRGYDIFDLCAYSNYEEVSYLLLHGHLPNKEELEVFAKKLLDYRDIDETIRLLLSFPVEKMNSMAALRLGTNLMRQKQTYRDQATAKPMGAGIASDEDSIAMETVPLGADKSIYEFSTAVYNPPSGASKDLGGSEDLESCYHLLSGVPVIASAIARLKKGRLPLEPDLELSFAANLLYMMTGKRPSPVEERIMDICLILHADHGMNASTFATMVVSSTLSDVYFSIGAGIGALNGPLHGGANEQVMKTLEEIGSLDKLPAWMDKALEERRKVSGFGHRVYKAYDPRARILGPLAGFVCEGEDPHLKELFGIATELEKKIVEILGKDKKIFTNVDFYSGLVYKAMGIDSEMFTPIFAVARVAGWTARVIEYLKHNRIFRPRAMYTGPFDLEYKDLDKR